MSPYDVRIKFYFFWENKFRVMMMMLMIGFLRFMEKENKRRIF